MRNRQVAAGWIFSRIPSARSTFVSVDSSGLPSAESDRYSASRPMPVLRESSDMPRARATSPSAAASTRGSSSVAAASRYAAISASSRKYSDASNRRTPSLRATFGLVYSFRFPRLLRSISRLADFVQ